VTFAAVILRVASQRVFVVVVVVVISLRLSPETFGYTHVVWDPVLLIEAFCDFFSLK
jgi:hypothetical protein